MDGAVEVEMSDSVHAPVKPSPERLREGYFTATERLLPGLVRFRDGAFMAGPLALVRFRAPSPTEDGWRFPIAGGVLVAEPGGELEIGWREGVLRADLRGYRPSLPYPVYRWTQYLFHHFQSRVVLLQMRGRVPAVAPPATPAGRLAAGAIDAGLCLLAAGGRARRAVVIGAAYHLTLWSLGGVTLGGLLLGQRVVAIDGSRLTPGQALLRLLCLPLSLLRLRAVHDEVAGTEVARP